MGVTIRRFESKRDKNRQNIAKFLLASLQKSVKDGRRVSGQNPATLIDLPLDEGAWKSSAAGGLFYKVGFLGGEKLMSDSIAQKFGIQYSDSTKLIGFAQAAKIHCPDCVLNADGTFKIIALGNIDGDNDLDVWTIDERMNLINVRSDVSVDNSFHGQTARSNMAALSQGEPAGSAIQSGRRSAFARVPPQLVTKLPQGAIEVGLTGITKTNFVDFAITDPNEENVWEAVDLQFEVRAPKDEGVLDLTKIEAVTDANERLSVHSPKNAYQRAECAETEPGWCVFHFRISIRTTQVRLSGTTLKSLSGLVRKSSKAPMKTDVISAAISTVKNWVGWSQNGEQAFKFSGIRIPAQLNNQMSTPELGQAR